MSIIQISRVQVRRGRTSQAGFPQLASGEFGWSIDQQELFIGNGSVTEGAPQVGNTRILTENDSNFFLLSAPSYTYKNTPSGPTVQTGPIENPYISRTIQDTLDDTVNIRKFGAAGDGITDDTGALQRAITHAAKNKKVLDLNEGTYRISGEILIPPFAELRGAGSDKTSIVASSADSMFRTVGFDSNKEITPVLGATVPPIHVTINGISFQSTLTNAGSMLKLDSLENGVVQDCEFKADPGIASTSTQATAIEMLGNVTLTCKNVQIKNCVFHHLGTSILSNYDISNIGIYYNRFSNVDAGIIFGDPLASGNIYGAEHVDISRNNFENINRQGLFVGPNITGVSSVQSSHNEYINVGIGYNNTLGDLSQSTDVITFKTCSNDTVNDYFSRSTTINYEPLANFPSEIKPIIGGPAEFVVSNPLGTPIEIVNGIQNLFVFPRQIYTAGPTVGLFSSMTLEYTLIKESPYVTRRGVIEITVNNMANTYSITDNFTLAGSNDGDVTFSVDLSRSDVVLVKYTNTGADGLINFKVNVRQ